MCRALEGRARAGDGPDSPADIEALEATLRHVQGELEAELQRV
jgi:hypothetical protein